ncbi:Pentatricopeptide repeat-containing protein [Cucurbita argyrosperma subsp. argyrosperma]|nr:Pentatricopeptide repeat-containing protein [Cucurbita argyrosperma subsp. argyrosperma]
MSFLATTPSSTILSPPYTLLGSGGKVSYLRLGRVEGYRRVTMRGGSENRKPLQKGRNLSIEAIQAVQSLKRAKKDLQQLDRVYDSKIRRLLKFDMMAVLRELLRQNECSLALKVFEDVRKEDWYKPQVLLYADIVSVLASNGLFEQVQIIHSYFKAETDLAPEIEGFNNLLKALVTYNLGELAMESYYLMKEVGCEPDKTSFRIVIKGLESTRESVDLRTVKKDAQELYGESLEFLEEEDEAATGISMH